jgi:hypothetical protein
VSACFRANADFSALFGGEFNRTKNLPQSFPPVGNLGTLQLRRRSPKMPTPFESKLIFTQLKI